MFSTFRGRDPIIDLMLEQRGLKAPAKWSPSGPSRDYFAGAFSPRCSSIGSMIGSRPRKVRNIVP